MRQMLHIRVFELKGNQYFLKGENVSLEEYLAAELAEDYMFVDSIAYGIEVLRVVTRYSPTAVAKFIADERPSDLANVKDAEGV